MKKLKSLMATALCLVCLLGFSGCGESKKAVTADKFTSILESKGFVVTESSSAYSQYPEITESYIALSPDFKYQIEFLVADSVSNATYLYNTNKNKFELSKGNFAKNKSVEMANYATYSMISNGKYQVVSRIDNTLVYVNVDEQYKDEVQSVLSELGY